MPVAASGNHLRSDLQDCGVPCGGGLDTKTSLDMLIRRRQGRRSALPTLVTENVESRGSKPLIPLPLKPTSTRRGGGHWASDHCDQGQFVKDGAVEGRSLMDPAIQLG